PAVPPDRAQLDQALAALAPKGRSAQRPASAVLGAPVPVAVPTAPSATGARPRPVPVNRYKPLFQPGNEAWEAMWKAKAGKAPSVATKRNSPPGTPGIPASEP